MVVQHQLVSVPFRAGLNTKEDSKQLGPAQLTVLENGVFTTPGKIRKRNGVARVNDAPFTARDPLPTAGVFAFQDELLVTDGRDLKTLANNEWVDRGAMAAVIPTQRQIHRTGSRHESQDSVRHPSVGLTCFAWLEQDVPGGRVRFSLIDNETGVVRVDGLVASGANDANHVLSRVKVAPVGANFAIFWVDSDPGEVGTSNELWWSVVSTSTLTAGSKALFAEMATSSTGSPGIAYDVTSHDGSAYVGWRMKTSARLGLCVIDSSLVVSSPVDTGYSVDRCIGLFVDADDEEVVAAWSSGFKVVWGAWTLALANVTAETEVVDYDLGPHYPSTVTGARVGSTRYVVTTNANDTTFTYSLLPTPVEVSSLRGAVLASKPLVHGAEIYCIVSVPSDDPTLFLVDQHGRAITRMLPSLAQGKSQMNTLAEVSNVGGGEYEIASLIRTHLVALASGAGHFTAFGVNALRLRFDPTPYPASVLAGSSLLVGGGVVRMYDGGIHGTDDAGRPLAAVELGFAHAPVKPVSAGDGPGKKYSYVVVWAHTDAQGCVLRSKPSLPLAVQRTTDITVGSPQIVTVKPLHLSAKAAEVVIEIYRTTDAGTVYHLAATAPNAPDSDTVAITDRSTDAVLEAALALYTTGSVLENAPPPACEIMTTHRNRVWCVDSMNPTTLALSRTVLPGYPVEFSDFLRKSVEEAGGSVTALASLDDKLILFKSDRIYVAAGQGPDDTGAQDDFGDFSRVTADVGCINHRTVVVTPNGVMFQSRRGIYLLDRSLSVQYIGAPVEAHNGQSIAAALLVPDAHQVRFFTADLGGVALVYDYLVGQWSTFTGCRALDATVRGGVVTMAGTEGVVVAETAGVHVDNRDGVAAAIGLKIVTGWLSVGTLQGFVRLRKVLVLGEWYSAHTLRLAIAYDYSDVASETVTGAQSASGVYQWEYQPARQKCEAVRLTLWDTADAPGQALDLSALTFEVGVKRGPVRMTGGGRALT